MTRQTKAGAKPGPLAETSLWERIRTVWPGALIVAATLLAYLPALHGGRIWDDDYHITPPELQSIKGLFRIWFDVGSTLQYYPFLHSAFWLEHRLWGDSTLGYHLLNLVLHALAALLVVAVLRTLEVPGAYFAGALFALHPVQVESVAWISEQKNLLSGVFYLGAFLVYLRFDKTRQVRSHLASLGLFVAAVLSKTVTATLPGALLVAIWWRRGRLSWRRDVLPVAPMFFLGAAGGLVTSWWELHFNQCSGPDFDLTMLQRLLIAGRTLWFCLGKLCWPAGLMFSYPRWRIDAASVWPYLFPLGALAMTAALWLVLRRTRAPLAAWLYFGGTLFPVLGFFNLYTFRYSFVADHYQYLACLGILTLAAGSGVTLLARVRPIARQTGRLLGLVLLGTLAILTWRQCRAYGDVETLYRVTIRSNPGSWMAHNNLGTLLAKTPGRRPEAIEHFEAAIKLNHDYPEAQANLGTALSEIPARLPESIDHLETAARLMPNSEAMHYNLGCALSSAPGRVPEAIEQFETALRLRPNYPEALIRLGEILEDAPGRTEEAVAYFERALKLDDASPEAHAGLGRALSSMPGHSGEAVAEFETALKLSPNDPTNHDRLGTVLLSLPGRRQEAIGHFETAIRLNPEFPEARLHLANALSGIAGRSPEDMTPFGAAAGHGAESPEAHNNAGLALAAVPGRMSEAITQFEAALKIRPDYAEARFNLGTAFLSVPNRLPEAIEQFEAALKSRPDYAKAHSSLGGALARIPARQADAISHLKAALRLNPDLAIAHFNLGMVLLQSPDKKKEALSHFDAALKLRPGWKQAQDMVNRLSGLH